VIIPSIQSSRLITVQDLENNPDVIKNDYPVINPIVSKDATDLLLEGSISPESINAVVLSHLHFDHTGDCTKFPSAEIIVGPGGRAATFPGYPADPLSPFSGAILQHTHFRELNFETDKWTPFAQFSRAYDYFGDGSFLLIDTPGHMPGHLGAIACTASNEWVFMGGDCCHHRSLLQGERPMSVTVGPNGTSSFHKDPSMAMKTIEQVRSLSKAGNVLVVLAHDITLEGKMPEYPRSLNNWKSSKWWLESTESSA
jgi:glyoxylase-like metal-dependent hydrolase (beta-lactamase superfamily II)